MMTGQALTRDAFVWLLGSLCRLHRIPWDPSLVLQQFPPPYSMYSLLDAGGLLSLRFHEVGTADLESSHAVFPIVAFERSCERLGEPLLIVRADAARIMYFRAGEAAPQTESRAGFAARLEPSGWMIAREPDARDAEPGETAETHRFGYRWFAKELLRHRRVWHDVLLASLAIQLIALATPLFTQVVIDKVVVHHTQSTLAAIAVGLALFLVFGALLSWLRQYLVLHTGNRVDAVLGSQLFRHLLRLPLQYFEQRPTGTLVARLHAVETLREFLAGAAVTALLDLPFLLVFLVAMYWYSWQLTLIALTVLALIAAASLLVTPMLRERLNRQFLLGARNQAFATEYLSGIETVKSLQMEPQLQARYDALLAESLAAGFATRRLSSGYNVLATALEQAMTLAILCAGAMLVMQNTGFTIGMLVAFQMFAGRLSQPVLRLAGLWQEYQQAGIAVRRLADVMDVAPEPQAVQPAQAPQAASRLLISDLGFRYGAAQPYLFRGLHLELESGKLVVLCGPSGSGKSTLARLLLGFYPPSEGRILLDGRDLRHLAANELRAGFGVVPQETVLFSGTVYENLVAANPQAGFEDAVHACRIAELHDVIEALPQGYNTRLGEHGVGLSGGQKQRLAIARAVIRRPRILIFDEATSNLDVETAERFAQTVNRLKDRAGILYIAHQVPQGLAADLRLDLKHGPGRTSAAAREAAA